MTLRAALLLLVVSLLSPLHAQGGAGTWSLLDASPSHSYRFEDGHFTDPGTGWIVNPRGEVWKTEDGGAGWRLLGEYPTEYIRSVAFPSEEVGIFGTLYSSRPLWRSTDGGETFVDVSSAVEGPAVPGICGLFAVNEQVVYGVGSYAGPSVIVKTTDGGATWTSQDVSDVVGSLVDVYFWDEQRGVAVGGTDGASGVGRAVVVMTEDGGETWTRRHTSSEQGEWAWKVSFPTPTTGYVSIEGNGGRALKTTDGGLTWAELALPTPYDFQGIGFLTADLGWASGRGQTMQTEDGGATWAAIDLDGSVNRFEFFGDTLAYAMGQRIHKLDRLPTYAEQPAVASAIALDAPYPNPTAGALAVRYQLPTASPVDLAVIDLLGRRVATLEAGERPGGEHEAAWDGQGDRGAAAPGLYLLRLRAGDQVVTRRVTVLGR